MMVRPLQVAGAAVLQHIHSSGSFHLYKNSVVIQFTHRGILVSHKKVFNLQVSLYAMHMGGIRNLLVLGERFDYKFSCKLS